MNGPGDIPISNGSAAERPCGLTSIIPSLAMSCHGRTQAFARQLQSKLRTLGAQNGDSPTNEEDPIINGTVNSWITHNDTNNQVIVTSIQPLRNHTTNQDTSSDSFFDFDCEIDDIESPGSPVDECEYSRLIETTSNTPHNNDCPSIIESDCKCLSSSSPINHNNNINGLSSRTSSQSSDGPYFDPDSSDGGSNGIAIKRDTNNMTTTTTTDTTTNIARTPTDFYDCIEANKIALNNMTNNELDKINNTKNHQHNNIDQYNNHQLSSSPDLPETKSINYIHMNGGSGCSNNGTNNDSLEQYIENNDSYDNSLSADSMPPSQDSTTTQLSNSSSSLINTTTTPINGINCIENNTLPIDTTIQDAVLNELQLITNENMKSDNLQSNSNNDIITNDQNTVEKTVINGGNNSDLELTSTNNDDDNNDTMEQLQQLKLQIDAAVVAIKESTESPPIIDNDEKMKIENQIENDVSSNKKNHQNLCDTDEEDDLRPQRVRRCSSLKTGKTPPGTPGRKKIVRFADVLGLDLADVKTFLDEIPNIPISAYQDLDVIDNNNEQPIQFGPKSDRILMPLFQQPGGLPSFLDIVRDKQVNLENAIITDHLNLTINGSVRVRNLDFHKSVHIRYSTDNWRTFTDLCANYVSNSCDGFSDRFTFVLCCNKLMIGQRLEFAVRFQCKGQQFWDSNYGSNYCFQCLPSSNAPQPTTITATQNSTLNSTLSAISSLPLHNNLQQIRPLNQHHALTNGSMLSTSPIISDAWCGSFY